jgi:hypothetical protein
MPSSKGNNLINLFQLYVDEEKVVWFQEIRTRLLFFGVILLNCFHGVVYDRNESSYSCLRNRKADGCMRNISCRKI